MIILQYFTFSTTAELVCLITALLCLRKHSNAVWRSMIIFMLITYVTELMGFHLKMVNHADPVHTHNNEWLYNLLLIVQIGFISLMFRTILNKYTNSDPAIIAGIVVLAIIYLYQVFNQTFYKYYNLTNIIASILFVLYGLVYYYLLLKDSAHENLIMSASFWWVAGILFFYFGRTMCNIFFSQSPLIKIDPKNNHNLAHYIYIVLNLILYSCWSYSFICQRQTTRSNN